MKRLQTRIEMIGPEEARRYLDNSFDHNRRISMKVVFKYARAMDEGRFESLNGQTIVLGTDGKLYDGQHRMEAIVLAGVKLPFLVVIDEDASENFKTIDQNRVRATSQFSSFIKNNTTADPIARTAVCLEKGASLSDAVRGKFSEVSDRIKNTGGRSPKLSPDMMEVVDFEEANTDILEYCAFFGVSIYKAIMARGASAVSIGMAAYIIRKYGDSSRLESFRRAVVADMPVEKSAYGLLKSIRKALNSNSLTKELTIGFVLADYAYFLEGEDKAANIVQAESAYEIMARRIEQTRRC